MLWQRRLVIALILGIILFLSGSVYLLFFKKNNTLPFLQNGASTTINGNFDINGSIDPGVKAVLYIRPFQKDLEFEKTTVVERATDKTAWKIDKVERGASYEVKARLLVGNNQVVAESDSLFVTAPASNEVLTFNVGGSSAVTASISGTTIINGYIPPGSTVVLEERGENEEIFQSTGTGLPAQIKQSFSYENAVSGKTYYLKGRLYDSLGKSIGSSSIIKVNAAAKHELIIINSYAVPPTTASTSTNPSSTAPTTPTLTPASTTAQLASVSGIIDFNGQAPTNSRVVIFQRIKGSSSYSLAVNNITPTDNAAWSWDTASNGALYDMFAVLKQKQADGTDKDIASSSTKSIASPAKDQSLTINSGITLPPPAGGVTVACKSKSGTNWTVDVKLDNVTGAASYWYQIGTTSGGTQLTNKTENAQNNTQQVYSLTFQDGVTYYSRYAYAGAPDLNAGSAQFSPFSGTSTSKCN